MGVRATVCSRRETSFDSLAAFEKLGHDVMANDEWRKWYQKLVPLVEEGHREIFSIVQ